MTNLRLTRQILARPAALALVALLLATAPAAATTKTVQMNDGYDFQPNPATISAGVTIKWKNGAVVTDHDVFGAQPSNYISSTGGVAGLHPGDTYSRTFDSAGTFPYTCRIHSGDSMSGTVIVGITVTRIQSNGTKFKITVGSGKLSVSSPFRRVIQVDVPGGTTAFVDWKTVRNATATYTPSASGTYRFRSLVVRTSDSSRSQPSPSKSVTK